MYVEQTILDNKSGNIVVSAKLQTKTADVNKTRTKQEQAYTPPTNFLLGYQITELGASDRLSVRKAQEGGVVVLVEWMGDYFFTENQTSSVLKLGLPSLPRKRPYESVLMLSVVGDMFNKSPGRDDYKML